MTEYEQLNECLKDMFRIFAGLLSKETLKAHMSAEEILAKLNIDSMSPKNSPSKVPEYDGDLSDLPKDIGLAKARAIAILSLCAQGVDDEHFVHYGNKKLFKPTKQHDTFYFDKKSRIACPKGDKKAMKAVKYLTKKAGKVGPPPEDEIEAVLPSKWGSDGQKKVKNMLEKVAARKDDATYINWASSRAIKSGNDEILYNDDHMICGPKKDKSTFVNLVAWLDENPDAMNAETPKAKKGAKGKAAKGKKVDDSSSKSDDSEKSEESDESEKSDASSKSEKSDASKSDDSEKSDASSKSDDSEKSDASSNDGEFVEGYDQKKLDALKKALDKRGKGFVSVDTRKPLRVTAKTKESHYFNAKSGLALKKCDNAKATKELHQAFLTMLE